MSHRDRNAAAPTASAGRGFYVGGGIALMVLHCAAGDMLIALATVAAALLAVGSLSWPTQQFAAVMLGTVTLSVITTIAVEYLGTIVWHFWAYTEAMPTLPSRHGRVARGAMGGPALSGPHVGQTPISAVTRCGRPITQPGCGPSCARGPRPRFRGAAAVP